MFKNPHTYSEWMDCLDAFKDEKLENDALYAMINGTIEWQSGVAERFTKAILDTIQYKLNIMQNNFNTRMSKTVRSNREIENNLLYARRYFKKLLSLSKIKVFPEELSQYIEKYIVNTAEAMQNSLLDSAKRDRTGVITSLVKKNAVNRFNEVEPRETPINTVEEAVEETISKVPVGAKRRILF